MKRPTIILPLLVLLLATSLCEAKKRRKQKKAKCVYEMSEVQNSPCDQVTATQLVNYTLSSGPGRCKDSMMKKSICIGCKFVRNTVWGECQNGTKSKVEQLQEGSEDGCPAQRTLTRKCMPVTVDNKKCVYRKRGKWSKCKKGIQSKRFRLNKRKSSKDCPKSRLITKKCKRKGKKGKKN